MSAVNDQQDIKRDKILEAAYQRFLHYGYSKTTMNEIAGDLSMSKALLYYYFPDKSQLYADVMRRLADEYLAILKNKISGYADLKEAFESQINAQHEFIVNNYNFFDFFKLNEQNLPDMIWDIISNIHRTEIELLSNAIRSEVANGKISPVENPEQVVDLLLDALHGVRVGPVSTKKLSFPHKEQLEEIHKKRLLLIGIFVRGLMY